MSVAEGNLVREKVDQAVEILREQDVDLWLTIVRETLLTSDPCLDLIAGTYSAWTGAFLISSSGERVAIVGRFDAPSVEETGAYDVIGYDESIRPALVETIERLAPRSIALNYSDSDSAADGLTHGLWRLLQQTFAETPFADRFVSSEAIVNALRGRKSPVEVERVREAVRETEEIFDSRHARAALRASASSRSLRSCTTRSTERGLGYAWGRDHCPAVNAGPEKEVGHAPPGELVAKRGELVHIDFGVSRADYCSDLQRVWYLLDEGESAAPDDVDKAWKALWAAMDAGAEVLKPGVVGWEVDDAARRSLVAAGYPEPMYALGHGLGRSAHDGGTVSGAALGSLRRGAHGHRGGRERLHARVRHGGAGPRLHRARGRRARHRRRHRVALDAAARALARSLMRCPRARRRHRVAVAQSMSPQISVARPLHSNDVMTFASRSSVSSAWPAIW